MQPDVARVLGVQADRGPGAVRVVVALAAQGIVGMEFDAVAAVGDLQAANLDVVAALEVQHHVQPLRAPQLRRRLAAAVVALAEDARRRALVAAGRRRRVAVVGGFAVAALAVTVAARRLPAHHVLAGADDQGVAAVDARTVVGGQGVVGMLPGAVDATAAAGVGRIGATVALLGVSAVGADVVGRCRRGRGMPGEQQQRQKQARQQPFEAHGATIVCDGHGVSRCGGQGRTRRRSACTPQRTHCRPCCGLRHKRRVARVPCSCKTSAPCTSYFSRR